MRWRAAGRTGSDSIGSDDYRPRDRQRRHAHRGCRDVDVLSAPLLRARITDLIHKNTHHLLIDMAQVPFLDSSRLSVLVEAIRLVRQHGGSVNLAAPREGIQRILRISGVDSRLGIYASAGEGIQALSDACQPT
jgi:anti-sigma B factor antagonist